MPSTGEEVKDEEGSWEGLPKGQMEEEQAALSLTCSKIDQTLRPGTLRLLVISSATFII
jgi:hypothetical protein